MKSLALKIPGDAPFLQIGQKPVCGAPASSRAGAFSRNFRQAPRRSFLGVAFDLTAGRPKRWRLSLRKGEWSTGPFADLFACARMKAHIPIHPPFHTDAPASLGLRPQDQKNKRTPCAPSAAS